MIKKIIFLLGIFSIQGVFALEENSIKTEQQIYESPKDFVQSFIEEALNFIATKELSIKEQERKLIESSRKYFDNRKISRFILGRHFKKFTDDQFEEFVTHFEITTSQTLVVLLRKSSDVINDITFADFRVIRTKESKRGIVYNLSGSVKISEGGQPIPLDLMVVDKDGNYKILDIKVEGISYIINLRNTYGSFIESEGIDKFLSNLKEKTEI